ncbi:endonuclease/exonuclease/phosphatase family protein [Cellulomonas sp. McL0617]|uniref:endonuclease/exonuclease/phosphatase family protein n=1 Tax=Cellulomonas sp. McL0617 TaxID=3415675 RepID=UPI003CF961CC
MTASRAVLVAGIVVGVVLVALAVPVLAGVYPVAQLVSFRAPLGLGALCVAIVLGSLPGTRRALLPLTLAFAVGALAQGAVLAWRSVPHGPRTSAGPDDVVVLSFNTADVVPPTELARLASAHHADVIVLPETSEPTAQATADLLAAQGRPMQVRFDAGPATGVAGTALLVSPGVGSYVTSEPVDTRFGSVRADPADPTRSPILVAAHTMPPGHRSTMVAWRHDTALVARTCATTPGAIVAGDLNATLDHPGLGDLGPCVDAAQEVGRASHGSWPSSAPTLLAAPIDHVLVDGRTWRVVSFDVLPATGGSDHRPILATIQRR